MIPWTDLTKDIRLIIKISSSPHYVVVRVTDIYERKIYRVLCKRYREDFKMVFTAGSLEKCLAWLNEHNIRIIYEGSAAHEL